MLNFNQLPLILGLSLNFMRCLGQITTNGTLVAEDNLNVLGENSWERYRPGWSLTVNDQCLYEFIFQFEHDESLHVGSDEFKFECSTGLVNKTDDGKLLHEVRSSWEKFPDYIWATMGFNHMSLDWHPCGIFSGQQGVKGYETAQYAFSFFRVTPEFRANSMTCSLNKNGIVPGEKVCNDDQPTDNLDGMGFFILPASILPIGNADRENVVNIPTDFSFPIQGQAQAHVGLRQFDTRTVPAFPQGWNDLPLFMSTYGGDLAMWQPRISYKRVSGSEDTFTSNTKRYHQTTFGTLPDSFAVHYDSSEGIIRLHMIGRSQICRADFLRAQGFAGGKQQFPNYDDLEFLENVTENGFTPQNESNGVGSGAFGQDKFVLLSIALSILSLWFDFFKI
jgi:hypothetical protein